MPSLNIFVTEETLKNLQAASRRLDRPIDELAEALVEEGALRDKIENPENPPSR